MTFAEKLRELAGKATPGPLELCERGAYGDFNGNSRVVIGDDRRLAVFQVSDEETCANAELCHLLATHGIRHRSGGRSGAGA